MIPTTEKGEWGTVKRVYFVWYDSSATINLEDSDFKMSNVIHGNQKENSTECRQKEMRKKFKHFTTK